MNWLQKIAQTYYHGSPISRAKEIEAKGYLDSQADKVGLKGTTDEAGMIWITPDFDIAKAHATYERGMWSKEEGKEGKVFEVLIPFGLKIALRFEEINEQQAEILNALNKRPYDPIRAGITLSIAMYKLLQHPDAPQSFSEILPLLGYNAMEDESGIAVVADKLPVKIPGTRVSWEVELPLPQGGGVFLPRTYKSMMAESFKNSSLMPNWLQRIAQDLPFVSTRHGDIEFETGRSVTFPSLRNTEPAPYFGSRYQQDIEPYGRYLLLDQYPDYSPPKPWEKGTVTFERPLVIRSTGDEEELYGEKSWKAELSRVYGGKTGIELSNAIYEDGYDGIITVWVQENTPGHIKEIVDLRNLRDQ